MKISRYIASNEISLKYRVYQNNQYRSGVLLMRAQRRVEEKQRKADMGEPVVKKVKAKRD